MGVVDHWFSYLYASEDSVCVDAVLRAAAVQHGRAGVTVVAGCMAAKTQRERSSNDSFRLLKQRNRE